MPKLNRATMRKQKIHATKALLLADLVFTACGTASDEKNTPGAGGATSTGGSGTGGVSTGGGSAGDMGGRGGAAHAAGGSSAVADGGVGRAATHQGRPRLPPGGWAVWTTEQYSAWGIIAATTLGADAARVKTWSDWHGRMWPE